jgi:hypothetical protein
MSTVRIAAGLDEKYSNNRLGMAPQYPQSVALVKDGLCEDANVLRQTHHRSKLLANS